jgi:kynurenine formamidase
MTTFVDLSHVLEPDMPAYPGLPVPHFETVFTHDQSRERALYGPGTSFQIAAYALGGNTGTYVDAPFHRHEDLPDLAGLALERLANLPGLVVQVASDGPITLTERQLEAASGKAVLLRTDWSRRWGSDGYFASGPFVTQATSQALAAARVALVGIDCANIDDMQDRARPAHTVLLGAGIPIVEHLCQLASLPAAGFHFFAVPPAIVGGTSFPVRAFAMFD